MTQLENLPDIRVLVFDSKGNSRNIALRDSNINQIIEYLTYGSNPIYFPYGNYIPIGKVEKSNIDFDPQKEIEVDEKTLRQLLKKERIDFEGLEFTALILKKNGWN